MQFGIIGGTGLYALGGDAEQVTVSTRYGPVTVERTRFADAAVGFIARHGSSHNVPPHRVNYRANIAALKELGVSNVLASAAVGSMSEALPPGSLAVLTQFLDFTRARAATFFDGDGGDVRHVDVTDPYCPHLRGELVAAAGQIGGQLHPESVYVCTDGPRFETPAEIRMFRQLGGGLVGMTNVPEVVLAREAGLCYAAVAIVTNWAAGMSREPVKHGDVSAFMEQQTPRLRALFERAIGNHTEIECACRTWAKG